ncbi:WD-REPEATS-REGION domain-containing protein [Mycena chlorophos]|uniref:WD-REPEATS-REGION domain-containing protein n=1 Tax=Mycena chlorophos TaxID=658473 RepID=A0A8H6SGD8_MYCCL|nr:WD-REPEATS-REGION domain-containing protein [Mycena chlorophos]
MPDAFFASSKARKRKRAPGAQLSRKLQRKDTGKGAPRPRSKRSADEELDSDHTNDAGDIDDLDLQEQVDDVGSGDEDDETPAEKRLRLAQLYLDSVKEGLAEGEFDAAEIDKEIISARLQQDVMEHSGKMHLFVADTARFFRHNSNYVSDLREQIDFTRTPEVVRTRGHRFSVTSAVASESGKHLFTSGKEGHIIKWDLSSGKKIATFYKVQPPATSNGKGKQKSTLHTSVEGHTDSVLDLALSSDGKYLASAGKDRRIGVWDAEKGAWMTGFIGQNGHKDVVSSLAFRKGTHQLYTGSYDRTLKVYDLSPGVMGYVETLFGHQDHVLSVDALRGETCVSVGGRDKTVRYWKIADETQLVFRGGGRSKIREVLDGGLRGEEEEEDDKMEGTSKGQRTRKVAKVHRRQHGVCCHDRRDKLCERRRQRVTMPLVDAEEKAHLHAAACTRAASNTVGDRRRRRDSAMDNGGSEPTVFRPHGIRLGFLVPQHVLRLTSVGSWDGDVRIWKLDPKLKSFTLVGTVSAPGVVNSLQFITPSKDSAATAAQLPILVIGLGKEHRLGRWWNIQEGFNGSFVVSFRRT